MGGRVYRFGEFRLGVRARELTHRGDPVLLSVTAFDCLVYLIEHRDRAVGRDELISAVWGRTELSESTLAHTIVRLRNAIGDKGKEQRCIRTVPRLGFRWVADVGLEAEDGPTHLPAVSPLQEVASETLPSPTASSLGQEVGEPAAVPGSTRGRLPVWRRRLWVGVPVLAALALLAMFLRFPAAPDGEAIPLSTEYAALVLPAEVEAQAEWAWLRLGLMDLVSDRLRRGGLPTVPSETVLRVQEWGAHGASVLALDAEIRTGLRIVPSARAEGGEWLVRLEAQTEEGVDVPPIEVRDADAMTAGRRAADGLLMALGRVPPEEPTLVASGPDELAQRVQAARLAGRVEQALNLLQEAPQAWRADPRVAWVAAILDCQRGLRASCQEQFEALLEQVSEEGDPVLFARVLSGIGWLQSTRGEREAAEETFSRAISLLQGEEGAIHRAWAHYHRGWGRLYSWRLEQAADDFGVARQIFLRDADVLGLARVDQALGVVAGRRGQFGVAMRLLESSSERFERLDAREDLLLSQVLESDIQTRLLEHEAALVGMDRAWQEGTQDGMEWYFPLAHARVRALIGVGRVEEALALADALLGWIDGENHGQRAEMQALLAQATHAQGRWQDAVRHARSTAGRMWGNDRWQRSANWVVLVRALRESGDLATARAETRRLDAWAMEVEDEIALAAAALMMAEQAWSEGDRETALSRFAEAMRRAERTGAPEWLVAVAFAYVPALLDAGRLDEALVVGGRIGPWSRKDMRAAWVQARLSEATGEIESMQRAAAEAVELAGERRLPALPEAVR